MVGPGWQHLEDAVRAAAEQYGVHVNDVCEKFGALDVKTDGRVGTAEHAAFLDAFRLLRAESLNICEWCGAPGELRDWEFFRGLGRNVDWIKTLCDVHAIMWSERRHWRLERDRADLDATLDEFDALRSRFDAAFRELADE